MSDHYSHLFTIVKHLHPSVLGMGYLICIFEWNLVGRSRRLVQIHSSKAPKAPKRPGRNNPSWLIIVRQVVIPPQTHDSSWFVPARAFDEL